jgi:hypothetical protein
LFQFTTPLEATEWIEGWYLDNDPKSDGLAGDVDVDAESSLVERPGG